MKIEATSVKRADDVSKPDYLSQTPGVGSPSGSNFDANASLDIK